MPSVRNRRAYARNLKRPRKSDEERDDDGMTHMMMSPSERKRMERDRDRMMKMRGRMVSPDILEFRKKQKPGAIMKPSTFQRIVRSAAQRGAKNPKKVAGAAYWKTVRAKYRKAKAGKNKKKK